MSSLETLECANQNAAVQGMHKERFHISAPAPRPCPIETLLTGTSMRRLVSKGPPTLVQYLRGSATRRRAVRVHLPMLPHVGRRVRACPFLDSKSSAAIGTLRLHTPLQAPSCMTLKSGRATSDPQRHPTRGAGWKLGWALSVMNAAVFGTNMPCWCTFYSIWLGYQRRCCYT